jgi:hypothetical protein
VAVEAAGEGGSVPGGTFTGRLVEDGRKVAVDPQAEISAKNITPVAIFRIKLERILHSDPLKQLKLLHIVEI